MRTEYAVTTDWRIAPETAVYVSWAGVADPLRGVEVTTCAVRVPSRAAVQEGVHRSNRRNQPICSLAILVQIVVTTTAIRRERVPGLPANDGVHPPATNPAVVFHEG